MEFTVIAQSTNKTLEGIEEKVSFVRLNQRIPINWFGSYVYLDDIKIKACFPPFVREYDLVLYCNYDVIGKQLIIAESDIDTQIGRFNSPLPFLTGMKNENINLYKLNTRFKRREERYILLAYVSTKRFYTKVWNDLIKSQNIKYFKLKSSFSTKKIDSVVNELKNILSYAEIKYGKKSLEYHLLRETIKRLIPVIEKEIDSNTRFYIF